MVQYGARPSSYWREAALRGSAEFAILRGDGPTSYSVKLKKSLSD